MRFHKWRFQDGPRKILLPFQVQEQIPSLVGEKLFKGRKKDEK